MYKKYKTVLVSGSTRTGKSTLLHKYIEYIKNDENILLIIVDPKEVEFFKYRNDEKVFYIANDYPNVIMNDLKPMINNKAENESKKIIIVDEYAEVHAISECKEFFEWLLENKNKQNVELVLATQLEEIFTEKYTENCDVIIKLK